jgi:hypothetical protein
MTNASCHCAQAPPLTIGIGVELCSCSDLGVAVKSRALLVGILPPGYVADFLQRINESNVGREGRHARCSPKRSRSRKTLLNCGPRFLRHHQCRRFLSDEPQVSLP